jgi:hypothetical protein
MGTNQKKGNINKASHLSHHLVSSVSFGLYEVDDGSRGDEVPEMEASELALTHRSSIRLTTPPPEGSNFSRNRILISCCLVMS